MNEKQLWREIKSYKLMYACVKTTIRCQSVIKKVYQKTKELD